MTAETPMFGGVEAGGTKFLCVVGSGPTDIRAELRLPTTTPAEVFAGMLAFFQEQPFPLAAIGVGSFGPVDLDRASPTYGHITSTPKPGWGYADIVGALSPLGVPVVFDTDVNAAALGEGLWGAAQGLDTFMYLTVGTGVGGGAVVGGQLLHGLLHPEMGHLPLARDPGRDPFTGSCPYHGDCLEGLTAGPALAARWGARAETFPDDHPAWELEAHYLAQALVSYTYVLSPQRIILGGGVMEQRRLYPLVRREVLAMLNGYIRAPAITERIEEYIVPPGLGDRAGRLGALALAMRASGA